LHRELQGKDFLKLDFLFFLTQLKYADRKGSEGYLCTLFGGAVDWKAAKQLNNMTDSNVCAGAVQDGKRWIQDMRTATSKSPEA
jgi:hypothetical protein